MKPHDILGIWKTDLNDETTKKMFGEVTMEFRDDGGLIYTIFEGGKKQIMNLSYEINADKIITDQPSSPRKEETAYKILDDGRLELDFAGSKSKFIKII